MCSNLIIILPLATPCDPSVNMKKEKIVVISKIRLALQLYGNYIVFMI